MSHSAPTSTRSLAALCLALLTLTACSSFRTPPITNADQLYDKAKTDLDKRDYALAIKSLELLEARFPFSNVTRQAQLDMLYAYYENGDRENVIDQADQFIRENPTHPRVDYAYYMKGLANFDRSRNILERWFRVDLSRRPPENSRTSFQAFQLLLQRFPDSQYAADARQRMIFLRNRLASYEVHVASYYLKRGAYVAALNRAKSALENYDGAPVIKDALVISRDAYAALGMQDLADKSALILSQNFPGEK
ncbi:MAG: outer membrane protein assembly factor BamD [Steroidobacteraceae bacterium]